MTAAERYSWGELYLILDLYSAWYRVLAEWLYLEGLSCVPTATIQAPSEADAKRLETSWATYLGDKGWTLQTEGRDVFAVSPEAFEAEEAQCYTDALEGFEAAAGLPATVCSVYHTDPYEFSSALRRKVLKILGSSGGDEDEEEEVWDTLLVPALLRRWKEFPASFPGTKFAVSGLVEPGGMSAVRVVEYDGDEEKDLADVYERALRATQAFMKEHKIEEKTFWFSNDEIVWKARDAATAKRVAGKIQGCQGSAKADGDTVKGPAREIWSVVSWFEFSAPASLSPAPSGQGPFAGEVVCFTGKLDSMEREDAQALVASLGGRTASSITSEVTLVVATREASSKRSKAEKRGLPIIDEKEFLRRAGR